MTIKSSMKNTITLIVMAICLGATAYGQGLFVRVSPGYALAATGDDYGRQVVTDTSSATETVIFGSNGAGFVLDLDAGYMFNEHVGFQLGFGYLAGAEQTRLDETGVNYTLMMTERSRQLRLSPAVVVSAGWGEFQPYGRFGLVLPLSTTTETSFMYDDPNNEIVYTEEIKSRLNVGFSGALGFNYALGSQFGIFAEVGALSMRTKGSSGMLTSYTEDGQDELADATTFEREWTYQETITDESNNSLFNQVDTDQPEDRPMISTNFSSFIIRVGVSLYLGGGSVD